MSVKGHLEVFEALRAVNKETFQFGTGLVLMLRILEDVNPPDSLDLASFSISCLLKHRLNTLTRIWTLLDSKGESEVPGLFLEGDLRSGVFQD